MTPGAYRLLLDSISRGTLAAVIRLVRVAAPTLPAGDGRVSAREELADRITRVIWEQRARGRDTAHAFLESQARSAGITGPVYKPSPPPYSRRSMRTALADLDEVGRLAGAPDEVAKMVAAIAVRHTEDAARRVVTEAVEGADLPGVERHRDAVARADAKQPATDEEYRRTIEHLASFGPETWASKKAKKARRMARPARWARMLTGAENCAFCVMLAARGAVYESDEEARGSVLRKKDGGLAYVYHDHCDCIAVPVYSKAWDGARTARHLQELYEQAQLEIDDDDLQDRAAEASPDQLRKLRKYLREHPEKLAAIVADLRLAA